MLTIYSTQGSPGASTAAMHLAAHWASQGREVLLIEADPSGGSISHNLGIQFTPGTASFVAAGRPMQSNHLIDHAQDVLFANLHVMPAPASPTGARRIFQVLSGLSAELREISETEMAVIIDGGLITAETAASGLTTSAAGVVAVCGGDSPPPGLQHLADALAADAGRGGTAQGCAVTVGESSMSAEEWQQNHGLTFSGSIAKLPDAASDLTTFLNRTKRKNKKWFASLEKLAEDLYPYAHPPVSSHSSPAGADSTPGAQPDDGRQTLAEPAAVVGEPAGDDPSAPGGTPPAAPHGEPPAHEPPAPPMAPAAGPDPHGQVGPSPEPPADTPSHYLPRTDWQPQPPVQPYDYPPAQPQPQPPVQPYDYPPVQPQPPVQPYDYPPAQPQPPVQPYDYPPVQPQSPVQPYDYSPVQPQPPVQPYDYPPAQPQPQPPVQPYDYSPVQPQP
ncbi:MAG: hypothetical protein OXL98_14315, partial [Acidimicrobiaceae bacterium]|nr:hypothetical protein [Acidimicrobiaceae bacterium]